MPNRRVFFYLFFLVFTGVACSMPIVKKDTHIFETTGLFMDCREDQSPCTVVNITEMKRAFQTITKGDSFEITQKKGFSICKDVNCSAQYPNTYKLDGVKALESVGADIGTGALVKTTEVESHVNTLLGYQAWIFKEKNINGSTDRIYINTYNQEEKGYDITFAILFRDGKVKYTTMTGGDINKTSSEKGLLLGPGDMLGNTAKTAAGAFIP